MAKIFGQLEKAQFENTTSDTASMPKGMITYRTDLNQAKVSNGTIYKFLIDEDSTQTLSNKTLASPSITGAIQQNEIATPSTPAAGLHKIYFKSDGKAYTLDSAGNEAQLGSGSGGGGGATNLITNGSADDVAASIFVPYADAAATRPVDGTGGSPTVTTAMTSTAPLIGSKSFLLTKPASNVQGQGFAVPFSVDPAYRAKSLKISMDYIVNSGTFVPGTSTTDGDLICYIYDITNSQLIEPSNIKFFASSTTLSDKIEATFQTSVTGTSYRLIFHYASTSALAFELKVDQVTVSPQVAIYGTPGSDWQAYTPTINGVGTPTNVGFFWKRIGDTLSIVGNFTTGTTTGADATFTFPAGLTIDTQKAMVTLGGFYGHGVRGTSTASTRKRYLLQANNGTANVLGFANDDYTTAAGAGGFIPGSTAFANGDNVAVYATGIPIQGWSSSVRLSDAADTRVVAARYCRSGNQSFTDNTETTVIWDSLTGGYDTHGAMDTSNGRYSARTAGYYRFSAGIGLAGSISIVAGNRITILYRINGGSSRQLNFLVYTGSTTETPAIAASDSVYMNVGDYIEIRGSLDFGGASYNVTSSNGGVTYFSIEKIQGPQAIAASETIAVKAVNTAGTTLTAGVDTLIPFATESYDTHGAFSSGVFTAPAAGKYSISATTNLASVTLATTNAVDLAVWKNGVFNTNLLRIYGNGATVLPALSGSTDIQLNAGDTISIYMNSYSVTTSLATTSGFNSVSIKRIGN